MKEHSDKCASKIHKYYGDRRNSPGGDEMLICNCDGFHTFDEIYDHRITLYIALCRIKSEAENWHNEITDIPSILQVWRSKKHSDGELCFGTGTQYVLGINKAAGEQITYHIPIERWDETNFAETLEVAPEWDGHTSDEVINRLKSL